MDRSRKPQDMDIVAMHFPVMTRDKFAELSGLPEGVVQGMIEKGHLPSVKLGRYRLVNIARLAEYCLAEYCLEASQPKPKPH